MTDNNVSELVLQPHAFLPVLSGLPQGSILGLLLFLLHINDLSDCLESSTMYMYMFADDSKCMHTICYFNDTIDFQDDLNSVYHWLQTWNPKFNLSKTAFIQFGKILQAPLTTFLMVL